MRDMVPCVFLVRQELLIQTFEPPYNIYDLFNNFFCSTNHMIANGITVEIDLLHAENHCTHYWRTIKPNQFCLRAMLKNKIVHWFRDEFARLENTPRLDDFHFIIFHFDLARYRYSQPAQFFACPACHITRGRIAVARSINHFDRKIRKQMILTVGYSLDQVNIIGYTKRFDINLCQRCRWDTFDPGVIHHLKSARRNLIRTAEFAERNAIANDATFLTVSAASARIVG